MRDKEKVVLKEIVNYANKFKFPEHSHILTDNFFNESKFPREITRAILGVLAEKGYIKYITSPRSAGTVQMTKSGWKRIKRSISRKERKIIRKLDQYSVNIIDIPATTEFLTPEECRIIHSLCAQGVLQGNRREGYTLNWKYVNIVIPIRRRIKFFLEDIFCGYGLCVFIAFAVCTIIYLVKSHILEM